VIPFLAELPSEPVPDAPKPAKPAPVICPEVWNTTKVDGDKAMQELRVLCGGAR
jgi:hypothetical protein